MSLQDTIVQKSRRALERIGLGNLAPLPEDIRPYVKRATASDQTQSTNEMARIFYSHEGRLANKWDHYHRVYDRHLSGFRGSNLKFLEIGVSHGGSLQVWRKYFGPDATIFGIDIDSRCAVVDDPPSINVRIGSQANVSFLKSVVAEMGGLDVVIDDGSHTVPDQRASFEVLFPLVSSTGLYIVEDLQTNYWRGQYEGGWRRRSTFIEQMKDLVDDMNRWWHTRPQRLNGAHQTVEAIHFYDSMVVIEKGQKGKPFSVQIGTPSFSDVFSS
jgi:hypothetical protein